MKSLKMEKTFPKLKSMAVLAPMAGVTDVAFRELCRRYGAGMSYTEFVSGAGISRKNKKTLEMLKKSALEKPSGAQIFGSRIKDLVKSAKFLEKRFDIIDINFGCPAPKIVRTCAGSELLKYPEKIIEIVREVNNAVKNPVTIKIRSGIDLKHVNAAEIAKIAESAGAVAICVHGRTQKQGYKGKADWNIIKKVKENVGVIVTGNGDVDSPEIFKKRLEERGVDYIMIGRGAIGNPYIFKQINDYIKTGKYDSKSKKEQFKEYLKLAKKYKINLAHIKFHALAFTKGIVGGAQLRQNISMAKSAWEIERLMR